ncbi:DUF4184 family protein [Neolewinella lacunae]|nr:DUF4184 family protein [Neolewinella lacunae]MDN3635772.1 DUF4184 family protein [Neolewinella lacunae]
MPFTFAHPAVVLPFAYLPKRWCSMTGLIIGSLTPDFEYFIKMRIESNFSHTLAGMFWFDLPMGILLSFIFHHFVRNALFENLPMILRDRLVAFTSFSWNAYFLQHWWVVLVSILIGAASHILWDGFTHHNGFFWNGFLPLPARLISWAQCFPASKFYNTEAPY